MVCNTSSTRADSQSCAAERVGAKRVRGVEFMARCPVRVVDETDGTRLRVMGAPSGADDREGRCGEGGCLPCQRLVEPFHTRRLSPEVVIVNRRVLAGVRALSGARVRVVCRLGTVPSAPRHRLRGVCRSGQRMKTGPGHQRLAWRQTTGPVRPYQVPVEAHWIDHPFHPGGVVVDQSGCPASVSLLPAGAGTASQFSRRCVARALACRFSMGDRTRSRATATRVWVSRCVRI